MLLPSDMKAVVISQPGGPEVLVQQRRPLPQLENNDVLVRIAATGVNRPDIAQRNGSYPPPKGASDLPGLEAAGEIVATGPAVKRWQIGDRVCALTPGGAYAGYVRTDAGSVLPIPSGFSLVEAAGLPETFFTVWHNVFQRGKLTAGESILVHGGTSGIGTTAIMLAKAFGATVLTTAGSDDKCTACLQLGADHAFNYRQSDWLAGVKQATGGRGVNLVLDMVGGDYIAKNYEAAAPDGRIVNIAFLSGARVEIDFTRLMTKRLTHTGSTMRPQSSSVKAAIATELEEQVWPMLSTGQIRPVIHAVLPLSEAGTAHALMESSRHIGKIILDVALAEFS